MTKRGEPLINKAEGRYSSWETRFAHRFQAFAELANPGPLSYADYLQATGRTSDSVSSGASKGPSSRAARDVNVLNNLSQGAQLCFQHARKLFDEAKADSNNADNKYIQATITTLTKVQFFSFLALFTSHLMCLSYTLCSYTGIGGERPVHDAGGAAAQVYHFRG